MKEGSPGNGDSRSQMGQGSRTEQRCGLGRDSLQPGPSGKLWSTTCTTESPYLEAGGLAFCTPLPMSPWLLTALWWYDEGEIGAFSWARRLRFLIAGEGAAMGCLWPTFSAAGEREHGEGVETGCESITAQPFSLLLLRFFSPCFLSD